MKRPMLKLFPVFAVIVLTLGACSNCCDCTDVDGYEEEICKDDFGSGGLYTSWPLYRAALSNAGCDC